MQLHRLLPAPAFFFILLSFTACRSAIHFTNKDGGAIEFDPNLAAKRFFTSHHDFYCTDPKLIKPLLTPRAFRVLKHHYDNYTNRHEIGVLDCDPWMDAQDGEISPPYSFVTLQNKSSEVITRFDYSFRSGPKTFRPQSVILKFQRSPSSSIWQLSDFIMPNNQSLFDLLERNP
ncbi:MAG: hypothetical protein WCK17_19575 [Verrucomicrobiota bacterium]|jgi:hypothetical protein